MHYKKVEQKINDIMEKCPIEAGFEVLVYNILDFALENKEVSVVDISRIWKNQDCRLTTDGGIPDIAILSTDFRWKEADRGRVYGLVEVKFLENSLSEGSQVKGQMSKVNHFIYTNGITWKYYFQANKKWEIEIASKDTSNYKVSPLTYDDLIIKLKNIDWKL